MDELRMQMQQRSTSGVDPVFAAAGRLVSPVIRRVGDLKGCSSFA